MDILSLFGGMDTGRIALENQGFKINKSYYSEIKKPAIKLTLHHNPDTVNLGDINNWQEWNIDYSKIFIVFSGSPCQDLSIAGNRSGLNGSKSSLFWVFIDILNHIKKVNPNVLFLQENVGSAPKRDIGIMSRVLGVYPVRINSKLVVAALRDRYYWTNIRTKKTIFDLVSDIPQPKDRKIYFKDILTNGFTDREKARAILESEERQLIDKVKLYKRYSEFGMTNLIFDNKGCEPNGNVRILNKQGLCKLQGFPANYCDILTRNQAASLLGDGWTLPAIEHILKYIK